MKIDRLSWPFVPLLLACFSCSVTKALEEEEEQQYNSDPDQQPLTLGHSFCGYKKESGPCKAILEKFFFNIHSRQCEVFEYGGCDGNENNFETLEECQEKCVVKDTPPKKKRGKFKQEKPSFCFLEEDPGICRGLITRYFYNKTSKKCEMFKYGGCLGNANNFKSIEDCQITCENQIPPVLNGQEEKTETLSYSLTFEVPAVSARSTVPPVLKGQEERTDIINDSLIFDIPAASARSADFQDRLLCQQPFDKGNCKANERRFYYHSYLRKCRPFLYSGCGGNENNFMSKKSCIKACKKDSVKLRRKKKKQSSKPSSEAIVLESA
ncbi:tissue factor pathway inhibitor isoform X1 [Pleurodeles waltl]